jgi:hypothetical protein
VLPSRDNLADCIGYAVTEMETAITNNIQMHFSSRQMKFLRAKYPEKSKEGIMEIAERVQ